MRPYGHHISNELHKKGLPFRRIISSIGQAILVEEKYTLNKYGEISDSCVSPMTF